VKSLSIQGDESVRQAAFEAKLRSLPSRRAAVAPGPAYRLKPLTANDIESVRPKEGTALAGIHRAAPFDWAASGH